MASFILLVISCCSSTLKHVHRHVFLLLRSCVLFLIAEKTIVSWPLMLLPEQVSDVCKRPNVESPAKAALEESSHMFENRVVQMLGQIKQGSCRPRAILFKVLADTVGLESRLMVVSFHLEICFVYNF